MKTRKFIPLLVIAAGLLAYHNGFTCPFIFDDAQSILQNPTIRHLWPIWQALSPPATTGVGGRPVINLSLAVNYAFGGTKVQGYHALNLTIHILAGLTLLGVVRRTLLRPVLCARFGESALPLALAVAVLWTVHPLQTEAVTYVSQRTESLMGLFYLLTLYSFIRGTESQRPGLWFTLCIVACLLGVATKEVMVSAPLMVLLYDRTFVAGSFREAWTQRWRVYGGLAASWLLLGYLMIGLHERRVGYDLGVIWWAYAMTECRAIVQYLWLAIWPHPLIFDYGMDIIIWRAAEAAPYALILLLLVAATVVSLWRWPAVGFLGAWLFAILAPASSVVPVTGQPIAEHRMYLPLAAVVTLVVMRLYSLAGRRSLVVFVLVAGGLGFLTVRRNEDYRSQLAIWNDTVTKRPNNARAHNNLGIVLEQTGNVREAIGQYKQALLVNPDSADAHNNLGLAFVRLGRVPEAMEHWEQALRINPDYAEVHYNLGVTLAQLGRVQEAMGHWEQAVRIQPDYAEAHNNLGVALLQLGRSQDAIGHYEQALRIKPDYAEAHNNLGDALLQVGRVQEAISHFQEALRIQPDFAAAKDNLARARAAR